MRNIIFISAILLCSCSANWHLKKAISKGLKPETSKEIVHDTVKVSSINDQKGEKVRVDTLLVGYDCAEFIAAISDGDSKKKNEALKDIQINVCTQFSLDTIYRMNIQAQGKEYELPIHITVWSDSDGWGYKVSGENLEIPVIKTETTNKFTASYGIKWYWLIVSFVLGCIAMIGTIALIRR